MVDHEGLVKEIVWEAESSADGRHISLSPHIVEYTPTCAPERLLHHPTEYSLPRVLEVAALTLLLGWLLAWLASHLVLRPQRLVPDTPRSAPPGSRLVLVDFPPVPLRHGPTCSISPFATKAEAFLRMAGLPYVKRVGAPGAPSPKGQIPYLERGDLRIGDSDCIIAHLLANGDVAEGAVYPATRQDCAAAVAIARLADVDLCAAVLYDRWVEPQSWRRNRSILLRGYGLPRIVEAVLVRLARRAVWQRVWEHGFARHSAADRRAMLLCWLAAVAGLLEDGGEGQEGRRYLFGAAPCAADASVFGALDEMACEELNPQLAVLLRTEFPALAAYHQSVKSELFPPSRPAAWEGARVGTERSGSGQAVSGSTTGGEGSKQAGQAECAKEE